MDIDVFPARELPTAFRVLRTALAPTGALRPPERTFLETYARITGFALAAADPEPIDARAVSIAAPHARKRLLQLGAMAALLSRPVRPDSLAYLRVLARELATHDPVLDVLDALHRGGRLRARMIAVRRAFRVMLKEAWIAEGPLGVARFAGAMWFKARVNKDQFVRYKRLSLLPEGTLGREYWKHMLACGFGFPGERGGIPSSVSYHDVAHVLAENAATPLGEIQQGCFQGGNRREDGFLFVLFVLLQFHHGIRITPATEPVLGQFDPELVLWAIHRGARCNVDMTHQWDYWPLMSLPLPEARRRVGLLPRLEARQPARSIA